MFSKLRTAIVLWACSQAKAIGQNKELNVGATSCIPTASGVTVGRVPVVCDHDLISRAKDGDETAFAKLFDAHKKRVYSLCLQMTGDVADAEDLTQDAFIQVFRKIGTFRGDSAFSTWLYRVAVNTVLMKLRRRKPRQVSLDEPMNLDSSLVPREYGQDDPRLLRTVDRITLVRAIKDLPDGYRTIFILHDIEGYDHREIASMLHCSTGNSKSQLHKARLKIREALLNQASVAEQAPENPRGIRARNIAVTQAPPRARKTSAPKGYEEVLLNCWEAIRMWGEHLQEQRGL